MGYEEYLYTLRCSGIGGISVHSEVQWDRRDICTLRGAVGYEEYLHTLRCSGIGGISVHSEVQWDRENICTL